MSNNKINKIKKELEEIRKANNGLLRPEDVVRFAKNKNTALHSRFTWDNNEAAERWRLEQASEIIRKVRVIVIPNKNQDRVVKVRKYVSLPSDRKDGSGYREINKVLTEKELKLEYIKSVQDEFEQFRNKLENISTAVSVIAKKLSKKIAEEKNKLEKNL